MLPATDRYLPEIFPERCVHSFLQTASCTACVDVCPLSSWQLDDESLNLDTETCDGCGLCSADCPQQALSFPYDINIRHVNGEDAIFLACASVVKNPGLHNSERGVVPCLNSINIYTMLEAHHMECYRILLARGDCSNCSRGHNPMFDKLVGNINRLLASRSMPEFSVQELSGEEWKQSLDESQPRGGYKINRRMFIRSFTSTVLKKGYTEFSNADSETIPLPKDLLPEVSVDAIAIWNPYIEPSACNGCDACVRICPHQAIELKRNAYDSVYRITPDSCNGCKLCVDICDAEAISIKKWDKASIRTIPLDIHHCNGCGTRYHVPTDHDHSGEYCRICATTNHNSRLYQVLK